MRVGLIGFGKTGKAVASVLMTSGTADLRWVLRKSNALENRSAAEVLGIETESPGTILSATELSAGELLATHPVDVIDQIGTGRRDYRHPRNHFRLFLSDRSPQARIHLTGSLRQRHPVCVGQSTWSQNGAVHHGRPAGSLFPSRQGGVFPCQKQTLVEGLVTLGLLAATFCIKTTTSK